MKKHGAKVVKTFGFWQLSQIRQVRLDRRVIDWQQQSTSARQGQVVDCNFMHPSRSRVPQIVLGGIIGGALVGFLIGAYVVVLTENHVIRRADFAHAVPYEQSQSRYVSTVLFAFAVVFAAIGPFVASASFGGWIRYAVYGLVCSIGMVVCVALIAAAFAGEQPFSMTKGSPSTYLDIARNYAIPIAIAIGPVAGILFGRLYHPRC